MTRMMEQKIDQLLETLYDKTQHLALLVEQEDSEPEDWDKLLDDREILIQDVQQIVSNGYMFSVMQKQKLEEMQELNLRMMPKMESRKELIKQKLQDFRQKKVARDYYNGSGLTGYGAFFDKKN